MIYFGIQMAARTVLSGLQRPGARRQRARLEWIDGTVDLQRRLAGRRHSHGRGSLNAFLHPLPDPRHTEGMLSILGSGFVLLPVLLAVVLWRLGAARYAVANTILCLALIPVITGLVQRTCIWGGIDCSAYQHFLNNYHGLIQRAGAVALYVPIGVVALLLRRSR